MCRAATGRAGLFLFFEKSSIFQKIKTTSTLFGATCTAKSRFLPA
jgi:hypothetical protein